MRLPKDCRFPEGQTEVGIRREGDSVILEPLGEWPAEFLAALGSWSEAVERPSQDSLDSLDPLSDLRDVFE